MVYWGPFSQYTMTDDIRFMPETPEHPPRHEIIANANDMFRKLMHPMMGDVYVTPGVAALNEIDQRQLMMLVQGFDVFTENNDPYKEHDFGQIDFGGTRYFWKIDLLDRDTKSVYTPDPTNPNLTWRVLTIMEASEY